MGSYYKSNFKWTIKSVTDLVVSLITEIYLQESAIAWPCQEYFVHCDLNWKRVTKICTSGPLAGFRCIQRNSKERVDSTDFFQLNFLSS